MHRPRSVDCGDDIRRRILTGAYRIVSAINSSRLAEAEAGHAAIFQTKRREEEEAEAEEARRSEV